MKRLALFALAFAALSGASCPVPSVGVACSNSLDASTFGFSLTVPAKYVCASVIPDTGQLVNVRWREAATGFIVSVILEQAGQSGVGAGDGVTSEDLGNLTNANGVTFSRVKITVVNSTITSYVALVTLASGNVLGVTVAAAADDATLQTDLNAILETVQLTP